LTVGTINPISFSHAGGELRVGTLVVGGFGQSGGELIVTNIAVHGGFDDAGGVVRHYGWVDFFAGTWNARADVRRLGPLKVHGVEAYGESYAPSIVFAANSASTLQFSGSRVPWTSQLMVQGWEGSFSGGGKHQLRFGDDDRGLRDTEVHQVWFEKPLGLPGIYPARILRDGEVVPLPVIIAERHSATVVVRGPPGFILQTSTNISGPFEDVAGSINAASLQLTDPARFFRLKPDGE
jgi:hypothetical protein